MCRKVFEDFEKGNVSVEATPLEPGAAVTSFPKLKEYVDRHSKLILQAASDAKQELIRKEEQLRRHYARARLTNYYVL